MHMRKKLIIQDSTVTVLLAIFAVIVLNSVFNPTAPAPVYFENAGFD